MPKSPAQSHAQEDITSLPKLDSTDHAPLVDKWIWTISSEDSNSLEYSDSDDSLSTSDTDTDSEPLSDSEREQLIRKTIKNIIELTGNKISFLPSNSSETLDLILKTLLAIVATVVFVFYAKELKQVISPPIISLTAPPRASNLP